MIENKTIAIIILSLIILGSLIMIGSQAEELHEYDKLVIDWCEYSNDLTDFSNELMDYDVIYDDIDRIEVIDCQ